MARTKSFNILEISSGRLWRSWNLNNTYVSGTDLLNLNQFSSNTVFQFDEDNTDEFFPFHEQPSFPLYFLPSDLTFSCSYLLLTLFCDFFCFLHHSILFANNIPNALIHSRASYTLSVHSCTVVYTRHVFTFRDVAGIRHHNWVGITPYIPFTSFLSLVLPASSTDLGIYVIALWTNDIFLPEHSPASSPDPCAQHYLITTYKAVYVRMEFQFHTPLTPFLLFFHQKKLYSSVLIFYQLPSKLCWPVQPHHIHQVRHQYSAF